MCFTFALRQPVGCTGTCRALYTKAPPIRSATHSGSLLFRWDSTGSVCESFWQYAKDELARYIETHGDVGVAPPHEDVRKSSVEERRTLRARAGGVAVGHAARVVRERDREKTPFLRQPRTESVAL